eukprot:COSAG05_NODE_498_length_9248_cov_20.530003_5_plen_164_part_00
MSDRSNIATRSNRCKLLFFSHSHNYTRISLDLEHALARQAVEMMTPHDSDPKETSIYHLNAGSVKDCKSEVFPSRDSTLYDTSHPTIAKAMARHPNEYNADGSVKDTKRKTHIKTTNPLLQTKSIVDLDVVGGVAAASSSFKSSTRCCRPEPLNAYSSSKASR